MPAIHIETPKNDVAQPKGSTQSLSGDVAMSMLLEVQRGVTDLKIGLTELKVDVKHLTTTTESIREKVETLEGKVESLVRWKSGVFGGVAVLAVLWGIFKAFSGYVHLGPVETPAKAAPAVALQMFTSRPGSTSHW
jgi:hypothetical protein|nr:hypothetical protein [Luteibacter rhizovicinus]